MKHTMSTVQTVRNLLAAWPRWRRSAKELVRYAVASAMALSIDLGVYAACLRWGWHFTWAALAGFALGMLTMYLLSVTWVFGFRRFSGMEEFVRFAVVGVMGLVVTELALLILIGSLGATPLWAKLLCPLFVFSGNFLLRRWWLFRPTSELRHES